MPNKDTPPDLDQVTVIIVTYDSAHCIAELSRTLASLRYITVVDNASRDDTTGEVARLILFPAVGLHKTAVKLDWKPVSADLECSSNG